VYDSSHREILYRIASVVEEMSSHIALGGPEQNLSSTEQNIVEFQLNEDKVERKESAKFGSFDQPFQNQCPTRILERWRYMGDFFLGGNGLDSAYQVFNPYVDLLADDTISKALKTFKYFRGNVEMRIVSSSSIYDFGLVFVAHVPFLTFTPVDARSWITATSPLGSSGTAWRRIMNHNPAILDVSQQQELVLTIPWVSPAMFVDLQALYSSGHFRHTEVLEGLTNMGRTVAFVSQIFGTLAAVPSDIPFKVYFRFVNTVTQGFVLDNASPPPDFAQSQSFDAVLNAGSAAVSSWAMKKGSEIASNAVDYGINYVDSKIDCYMNGNCGDVVQEGKDLEPSTVTNIPDAYGDLMVTRRPNKVLYPWHTQGPTNHSIREYLRVPSFIGNTLFTAAGSESFSKFIGPQQFVDSRVGFVAQYFRYCRGSYVLTFHFVTSPLVSTRFAIQLLWDEDPSVNSTEIITKVITIRGSEVVSFQVPYLFMSPYLPTYAQDSHGLSNWPRVVVSRVSPIMTQRDVEGSVQLFSWVHVGQDFEFHSQVSGQSMAPNPDLVKDEGESQSFACDYVQVDEPTFHATTATSFGRPMVRSLEDLARMWDLENFDSFHQPYPYWPDRGWGVTPNLWSISSVFLFFRGSVDYKLPVWDLGTGIAYSIQNLTRVVNTPGSQLTNSFPEGRVEADPRVTPVLEFRAPLMCKYEWICNQMGSGTLNDKIQYFLGDYPYPVDNTLYVRNLDNDDPLVFGEFLVKGAEDFGFYYCLPPPYEDFWPREPVTPSLTERADRKSAMNRT